MPARQQILRAQITRYGCGSVSQRFPAAEQFLKDAVKTEPASDWGRVKFFLKAVVFRWPQATDDRRRFGCDRCVWPDRGPNLPVPPVQSDRARRQETQRRQC